MDWNPGTEPGTKKWAGNPTCGKSYKVLSIKSRRQNESYSLQYCREGYEHKNEEKELGEANIVLQYNTLLIEENLNLIAH